MNIVKHLAVAGCIAVSGAAIAQQGPVVKVDGSSTVYPVTEAVAEEFQKLKKNAVKVTVGISGTGGGFKKFCRGETDVSNASRPILTKECVGLGFVDRKIHLVERPHARKGLRYPGHAEKHWQFR